jgi:hypothetical protein
MATSRNLPPSLFFQALTPENHEITSEPSPSYNCIAWAVGDDRQWWWPAPGSPVPGYYWPPAVALEVTVEAFVAAFRSVGFEVCTNAEPEPGFEKIALYLREGTRTHAARMLPDGRWSSKLGKAVDIAHTLEALEGSLYGTASVFLHRPERSVSRDAESAERSA